MSALVSASVRTSRPIARFMETMSSSVPMSITLRSSLSGHAKASLVRMSHEYFRASRSTRCGQLCSQRPLSLCSPVVMLWRYPAQYSTLLYGLHQAKPANGLSLWNSTRLARRCCRSPKNDRDRASLARNILRAEMMRLG